MAIDHSERHRTQRIGWLRAAVLGANDGILSTASLIVGVAAADTTRETVLLTGLAGLLAGALSMAAGEYVSVSSQEDTEKADLEREKNELATDLKGEQDELTSIYIDRGLEPDLARRVALHLMAKDPLTAHWSLRYLISCRSSPAHLSFPWLFWGDLRRIRAGHQS